MIQVLKKCIAYCDELPFGTLSSCYINTVTLLLSKHYLHSTNQQKRIVYPNEKTLNTNLTLYLHDHPP